MTISTLTPRSLPSPLRVSLARSCVLGLASWWLLRELDGFLRRLLARLRRPVSSPSADQILELSIIDTRGDASDDQLVVVLREITGTNPDDGGEVKTSPPRMRGGGSGKTIARFPGLTVRYIRSSEAKPAGAVAVRDARPA